jgi:hypothetical protein
MSLTYPILYNNNYFAKVFNGTWGMLRKFGVVSRNDGGAFVCSIWFGWIVQLALQALVQPGVLPGPNAIGEPPELTAFCFGMNFMPAYLDSKSRSLPQSIAPDYYGEGRSGYEDNDDGFGGPEDPEKAPEFSDT